MLEGEPADDHCPEPILPDGCVEIILNFGSRFEEIDQAGDHHLQPRHLLVGQMTRPVLIVPSGRVELIGIRFQPGGTIPFLRASMQEVVNSVVNLGALSGKLEQELLTSVDRETTLRERVAGLEIALARRLGEWKQQSQLTNLTASIVRTGGRISVDTLAQQAATSPRQLRRKFLQEVGIGPKLLCRLLRFQQVFRAIGGQDPEWANVAVECGYYDQAHLINDFRQFANQTPAVLLAQNTGLTEAFLRKNRASVFSNTPAA